MSEEKKYNTINLDRVNHYVEMNREAIKELKQSIEKNSQKIDGLSARIGGVELKSTDNVLNFTKSINNLDKMSTIQDEKITNILRQIIVLEERVTTGEDKSNKVDTQKQDVVYKIILQVIGALIGYFIGTR